VNDIEQKILCERMGIAQKLVGALGKVAAGGWRIATQKQEKRIQLNGIGCRADG
jgi:hypothetical protein